MYDGTARRLSMLEQVVSMFDDYENMLQKVERN